SADAQLERGIRHLRRRPDLRCGDPAVADLPQLRDLYRHHRHLSPARPGLLGRVPPHLPEGVQLPGPPLMRTFGSADFWFILAAARWTIALSLVAFIGGAIVGLIVALCRSSQSRLLRIVSTAFIRLFPGTPLLLQLFLIFFGAPVIGFDINPWVAAGVALVLNSGAFLGEIWRGCIDAVPRGQWEAAEALSLSYSSRMRDIILPQAAKIAI